MASAPNILRPSWHVGDTELAGWTVDSIQDDVVNFLPGASGISSPASGSGEVCPLAMGTNSAVVNTLKTFSGLSHTRCAKMED